MPIAAWVLLWASGQAVALKAPPASNETHSFGAHDVQRRVVEARFADELRAVHKKLANGFKTPPKSIMVAGHNTCIFFINAQMVAEEVMQVSPDTSVDVELLKSEEAYKAWLATEKKKYGGQAMQHTTAPFVTINGKFVGGYNELVRTLMHFDDV